MSVTRRTFILSSTYAGAGIAITSAFPSLVWASSTDSSLSPYLTGVRMAATPATHYCAYRSKVVSSPDSTTWVQIDLKKSVAIDSVRIYPASERMYPGRDQYYAGEGFPLRFLIEAADDENFTKPAIIADLTQSDFPDPKDNITQYVSNAARGRYVRLTATRLRPVKMPPKEDVPLGKELQDSPDYTLTIAKIGVISGSRDIAVGCKVSADETHGNPNLVGLLTRAPRQDGENIQIDNPHLVTDPSKWKPAKYKAQAPKGG